MKTFTAAVLFLATAFAAPAELSSVVARQGASLCPNGLFSVPQCCQGILPGLLGLGCEPRKFTLSPFVSSTYLQASQLPASQPTKRLSKPCVSLMIGKTLHAAFSPW